MSRILPHPLLAIAIFTMWGLLTGFTPGHLVLGLLIALTIPRVMLTLAPEKPTIRFGPAMVKLAGIVLADIIRSNLAVGRIVMFKPVERRSDFILLPVELRSPYALAVLAIIITATPGTLWVQHDAHRNVVLIHVLDLVDEAEWVELIKHRYERLLKEIFE